MTFDHEPLVLLADALKSLDLGFDDLPPLARSHDIKRLRDVLLETADRLRDNFPYHHPLYIGQMLKPPHPIALAAYALAMHLNPNNHALDGGRASSAMEKECVAQIATMFGWQRHLGHLTGGGTIANFEALWIARELAPGRAIAASAQAHYTHARLSSVLGVPFVSIPIDPRGRMDVNALEDALNRGQIATVVVTLGTTAAGAIDQLDDIVALREGYGFRLHVDAAYGGYFTLACNLDPEARRAFDCLSQADSIVIDPHKHGLQPYGCGCVLFRDPSVGRFYRHDSPYTYFSSDELHLGEISLECSRPGAAAVALWATMQMLPLVPGGEFALSLEACRDAALALHDAIATDARFLPLLRPELDIVTWAIRAETTTQSSRLARELFASAARQDLHFALAAFPRMMVEPTGAIGAWDSESVTCLRACAMKPEHKDWMPRIIDRLRRAADDVP